MDFLAYVVKRVVFARLHQRNAFGQPKLSLTGYEPAARALELIKKLRADVKLDANDFVDPKAVKGIHMSQYKWIARDIFLWAFGPENENGRTLKTLATDDLNKARYLRLAKKTRAPFARSVIDSFYRRSIKIDWWMQFRLVSAWCVTVEDESKYVQRLTLSIEDAMPHVLAPRHRTTTVLGLIEQIRATEDFTIAPILADALQDAGYDNQEQLDHLRAKDSVITLGSWLFKAAGRM